MVANSPVYGDGGVELRGQFRKKMAQTEWIVQICIENLCLPTGHPCRVKVVIYLQKKKKQKKNKQICIN